MIIFKTTEEFVAFLKANDKPKATTKKNSNMFYFGGQKIKKSQIWKDIMGWEYVVEGIDSDKCIVTLKRQKDNYIFNELASSLVAACKLFMDVKNQKKVQIS